MGGQKAPMPYQNQHNPAIDNATANSINQNTAHTGALYDYSKPLYESAYNTAANNPGNAIAQAGAMQASQWGQQAGQGMMDRGKQFFGMEPGIIQQGWDPQGANMNWGMGQVEGAADVNAAQSGVAGSPFAGGMHNDAVANFMRQWQAGAQDRQGTAINQLNQVDSLGRDSTGQGLSTYTNASLLPQAEANDQNNQKLAALSALVQGLSGITSSSQGNVSGGTGYLNSSTNQNNAATNAVQANNATTQAMLGALGQAAGIGAMFIPGVGKSDRRLKENIVKVGELANGIAVYTYNFIGKKVREMGVMAQEVLPVMPEAVIVGDDGFYQVNYGMLL
jgi:hypothetical protein